MLLKFITPLLNVKRRGKNLHRITDDFFSLQGI